MNAPFEKTVPASLIGKPRTAWRRKHWGSNITQHLMQLYQTRLARLSSPCACPNKSTNAQVHVHVPPSTPRFAQLAAQLAVSAFSFSSQVPELVLLARCHSCPRGRRYDAHESYRCNCKRPSQLASLVYLIPTFSCCFQYQHQTPDRYFGEQQTPSTMLTTLLLRRAASLVPAACSKPAAAASTLRLLSTSKASSSGEPTRGRTAGELGDDAAQAMKGAEDKASGTGKKVEPK
jgi:hypothetical protein